MQNVAKECKGKKNLRSHLLTDLVMILDLYVDSLMPSWSEKGICPLPRPFPLLEHYSQVVDAVRSTSRNPPCEDVKGSVMVHSMTKSAPRQLCSMRRGERVFASVPQCKHYLYVFADSCFAGLF